MTNLILWLLYGTIFIVPYCAIVLGAYQSPVLAKWMLEIQILPVALVALFGIYAGSVVLYRTLTINDCPEAERELLEQIKQAKEDLELKLCKVRERKT